MFSFRVFVLAMTGLLLPAQEPVRTDLVVRDSRGRPVRNLEPGELAVKEDGVAATIRLLHYEEPSTPGPIFLIFEELGGDMARFSRDGANAVLSARPDSQPVSIYRAGDRIEAILGPSTDAKQLRAAVESVTGKHPAALSATGTEGVLQTAAKVGRETHARPLVALLLALAAEQSTTPGRKAVVLFSQGAGIGGMTEDALRAVISTANRAGLAIYTVDAANIATTARVAQARESMMIQLQDFGMTDANVQGPGRSGAAGRVSNYARAGDGAGITPDRPVDRGALTPLARLALATSGFSVFQQDNFRGPLKRVPQELAGYYRLEYLPADARVDARFRQVHVESTRKLHLADREGYFAAPVVPGVSIAPFELPLLELLAKPPLQDFPHTVAVGHYRQLTTVSVEVKGRDVQFTEEPGGGLHRAHLSALALIRDRNGRVVDKLAGDTPVQCPASLLDEMQERYFLFDESFQLTPGDYTLEAVVQDRLSGRAATSRRPLHVDPPPTGFSLGTVRLTRHIGPADANHAGSPLVTGDNRISPALDGHLAGGRGARATLFLRLYPGAAPAATQVEVKVLRDSRSALQSRTEIPADATARLLHLDIGSLAPGSYTVEVEAVSAGIRQTQQLPLVIEKGAELAVQPPAADTLTAESPAQVATTPPNAEQQRLLNAARQMATEYTSRLPNFVCTQITRRMLDQAANGHWVPMQESTQLVSFYGGQEHYHSLTVDTAATRDSLPAMTSSGEFGSILKQIFGAQSEARFAWVRSTSVRGRPVQVFQYTVDAAHSQYRVGYNGNEFKAPVRPGFHGQVFLDEQTAGVVRLTHETEALPAHFPIRQFSLTVDYDDISVGGKPYLLPMSATLNLRLRKKTLIRNEVSFRSYQRFTTESRVLSFDPQQAPPAGQGH